MADYSAINRATDQLSDLYRRMNKEIFLMNRIIKNLDIFWDGDAQAAFGLTYSKGFTNISVIMLNIYDAIELLKWVVNEYQKTENMIEQMIGGIRF